MSEFGSSIGEKKQIILRNPDGTFMHGFKSGEKESVYLQIPQNEKPNDFDNLSIADSDLQYIVDNYEQFDHGNILEEFISILNRNLFTFILLLTIELTFSIFLILMTWKRREMSIDMLSKLYRDFNHDTVESIFYTIFGITVLVDLIFYPLGYYATFTKKFKMLSIFSTFSLVTGVLIILVVYTNLLFLLLLVMRLVLYIYSKFVASLLVSIIVLPSRMQHNEYGTI